MEKTVASRLICCKHGRGIRGERSGQFEAGFDEFDALPVSGGTFAV